MNFDRERKGDRTGDIALAVAGLVLCWFTALSALGAAAFLSGRPLPGAAGLVAAGVAGGMTWRLGRRAGATPGALAVAGGLTLLLVALASAASLALLDLADDSQTYHLSAVIRLAQGWVPWREPLSGTGMFYGWCMDHYPRASYLASAAAYLIGGRLDLAKLPQVLLAGGAFALALAAARSLWPARPRWSLAAALVATANPIALVQLATSYVDGLLGSALLAMAAGMTLLARRPSWLAAACTASAAALACGLKFSGVAFAAVLAVGGGFAAALLGRAPGGGDGRGRRALAAGLAPLAGVAAALLLLEANPYVTNTVRHGNPFWPVVAGGPGPWSPMAGDEPGEMTPSFAAHDRATRLALSLFARADSLPGSPPGIRLKVPFTIRRAELGYFRWVDTRASGLGPLFSGALVLAAAALILVAVDDRRRGVALAVALAALLCSALLVQHAWFARYVPQLWLAPVAAMAFAASASRRSARALAWAVAVTLALNSTLVGAAHLAGEVRGTREHRAQLARLADLSRRRGPLPAAFGRAESHRVRFAEHGVRFSEGPLPCADPVQLLSLTDTRLCVPEPVATVVWPGR